MFLKTLIVITLACVQLNAADGPRYTISYNILETAAFMAINKIFVAKKEPKLIYVPLHFDGHMKLSDSFGISFALVYRYENYRDEGPLYSEHQRLRAKKVWTNYHEVFLLAGPRFSFFNNGLDGFYFSMKAGLGFAKSPLYVNLSVLASPEVGYALNFGNPGFHLSFGLGILANLALFENINFAVPWNGAGPQFTPLGIIVHQAIPVLNIGLGYSF